MYGRKGALWLAATIGALALLVPASASALTGPTACNGATELCDRPFNEIVLPGTHNSMSSQEYNWAIPNQIHSIPTQLEMGVRAFLIDTHYGKFTGAGRSGISDWNTINDGNPVGNATPYLCHTSCLLGASELEVEFSKVTDFLANHPREVLYFMVENKINPADFASVVSASGLIDYVYTGSTSQYPTVAEMIDLNQRVVFFSEGNTGDVTWFHNGYAGAVQETPYDFRRNEAGQFLTTQEGIDLLTNPDTLDSTCRPHRGGTSGPIFQMNHWVNGKYDNSNGAEPDPEVSAILNAKDVLVNRARACETRRGLLPTVIAVDHFGEGDLLGAVDDLNGVAPDPEPEPKPKLVRLKMNVSKKVTVRAGKFAVVKVNLTNKGNRAGAVRVCAKVPGRLAFKPRCVKRNIKAGAKLSLKLKVRTRGRAKGRGQIRVTAVAGGKSLTKRTTLVVKKKKQRKRR